MSEKPKTRQEAALSKAFEKLGASEKLIDVIVHELMVVGPKPQRWRLPVGTGSSPIQINAAPINKILQKLARSARGAVEALDELSPSDIAALNYHQAHVLDLKLRLRILHGAAEMAIKEGKAGRPPKVGLSQAQKIARAVWRHYRVLTGNKANAPARLIKLLTDVYKALDIDANARGQLEAINREEENACIFPTHAEYAQEIIRRNEAKRREEAKTHVIVEAKARSQNLPK